MTLSLSERGTAETQIRYLWRQIPELEKRRRDNEREVERWQTLRNSAPERRAAQQRTKELFENLPLIVLAGLK